PSGCLSFTNPRDRPVRTSRHRWRRGPCERASQRGTSEERSEHSDERSREEQGDTVTRVLVVEDEESFSDALSYMLRREGYEVAVAATGTSALTEFDRSGADIVLLDLMLPEMSGTEVCRQLRSRSHVPIIMVTARDSEID